MTALDHLAGLVAQRERQWLWWNIDLEIRDRFTERLAERLPELDPEAAWAAMPIKDRRELVWHLTRTSAEHRASWQEDAHRLEMLADQETVRAFQILIRQRAS
jgi:hypothetical protein